MDECVPRPAYTSHTPLVLQFGHQQATANATSIKQAGQRELLATQSQPK